MDVAQIKSKVVPVMKKAGVLRSSLFGSYSRGENTTKSDIDFLIEFPRGKSLLDLIGLEMELESILGRKVDLVTFKSVDPLIKKYVEKDQVHLF